MIDALKALESIFTRESLMETLEITDRRTRDLLSDLDDAQLAVPYRPGINPPLWELGHAAFFYEVFVLRALDRAEAYMPGYDAIWDSFEIKHRERWVKGVVPNRTTVLDYYERILDAVRHRVDTRELKPEDVYLCKYAIFHQNMHLESMIWCRQTLGYPKPPFAYAARPDASGEAAVELDVDAAIPGGVYPIGMPAGSKNFATTDFAFDNEKPGFEKELKPFRIAKTLVSNETYRAFVEDGGYRNPRLWSFGGRHWLENRSAPIDHPPHWRRGKYGEWEERCFDNWRPLVPEVPILHVSFWEADAFCRWAGRRLPTEFEWEAAARGRGGSLYPWGKTMMPEKVDMDGLFCGLGRVDSHPEAASVYGCLQMLGTAWEWTSSQFLPYDGFAVDMYPYMSTLQFGDHKVTRGGSSATSSCLIRNTYRQAYHPDRQDVFTGIRTCAID